MASNWYTKAIEDIMDGTIDLAADTLKVMLVTSAYTFDRDHELVDAGGANDLVDAELSGTGYAGGWGGSGRKTLGSKSITTDHSNNRAVLDAADSIWTGINAGTPVAAVIIKEGGSDDTTSRPILYMGFTGVATSGGDLTVSWNSTGIGAITT